MTKIELEKYYDLVNGTENVYRHLLECTSDVVQTQDGTKISISNNTGMAWSQG